MPNEQEAHDTELSKDAEQLLLEASKNPEVMIEYRPTKSALQLYVNSKPFGDAEDSARWSFALDDLQQKGFVTALTPTNQKFRLTRPARQC
jgi:hypothetical protein